MLGIVQRKGNHCSLLVEMQTGTATRILVWRTFKELKVDLPHDPAIILSGKYPKDLVSYADTCRVKFIATLVIIAGI